MTHTPNERHDEIILELLCCVMVVDKTASATEKAHIHTILSEDGSNWTTAEVDRRIKKFIDRVKVQGFWSTLDDACDKTSALPMSRVEKLVQNCVTLAKGDSEFHDRERKAIGRILTKLPELQVKNFAMYQQRAKKSRDFQETTARKVPSEGKDAWWWVASVLTVGGVTAMGLGREFDAGWWVSLVLALVGSIAMILNELNRKRKFRKQFEDVLIGMTRSEVILIFGKPPRSERSDGTKTTLVWGTLSPKYTDEFSSTIYLNYGVVYSKKQDWGTQYHNSP
jgi:uncharacterized tellurite resistance protein B-like protein